MRILAIDLGTSSLKIMRLDEHARVLTVDRVAMTGLSVEHWIAALQQNLQEHGDQRQLGGIAITGQMHGLMTRDDDGGWGESIPWHDGRSADLIPAIREALGSDSMTITGGPIAPGFLAASLYWVQERDPARWSRITSVHLPKDALVHELTGEHVTDPTDAAGTGLYAPDKGDWAWDVVETLGIPRAWLPRLMPSGSIAGGLGPEYASLLGLPRGLPIILAGGDAPVGAFGVGVTREHDALVMLSTGAQVILPLSTWTPDPDGRWYTWPSVAPANSGLAPYLRAGTLLNAGNVTAWSESVLQEGSIADGPGSLVALPHLIGTREDPSRRGAIVGMSDRTTPGEIRRALVEGIAFSIRAKMDEMTGGGTRPTNIRLGGGLAHRPDIRQLFADVLRTPIAAVDQPEATAYGAGLLALHNLTGLAPDHAIRSGDVAQPIPGNDYEDRYALYRDLERMLSPLMRRFAALGDRER